MKLIDASRLINETDDRYTLNEIGRRERDDIVNALEFAPTVDAEQVIRCKDCKFLRFTGTVWKCQNRLVMMLCEPNDFCSRAERREE